MRNILLKGIIICLIVMAFSLGFATLASAEVNFYLGVSQVTNSINTDQTYYDSNDYYENETVVVPSLTSGEGFGVTWGIEFPSCCLEFGLSTSAQHGDYYDDSTGDTYNFNTTYTAFDINFKKFIGSSRHFRPYFLIGLNVSSLVVEDGSFDYYGDATGDATYTGAGLNIGGGLDLKILPHMSIKGEFIYRTVEYTSAEGTYTSGALDEYFDGGGLCTSVGVNIYF